MITKGLDPSHSCPQLSNKTLNFIVRLSRRDAFGRANVIHMPALGASKITPFIPLSSVIRSRLAELFRGRVVKQFPQFHVTCHCNLAFDEDELKNVRAALRQGLDKRHDEQAVRLEASASCSEYL